MDGINNREYFLRFQITWSRALLHLPPNFNVGTEFVSAFSLNLSFGFFRHRPDLHEMEAPRSNIEIGGRKRDHVNGARLDKKSSRLFIPSIDRHITYVWTT